MALSATTVTLVDIGIDLRVLGFTTGLAALVAVVCGLAPAFAAGRASLVAALGSDSRQVAGGRAIGRRGLVAVQITLSVALLVGAGLFVRTLETCGTSISGFRRKT